MKDLQVTHKQKSNMKNILITIFSIIALSSITFAAFFLVTSNINHKDPIKPNITTIGEANITAKPDSALINVVLRSSAENILDAQKNIDEHLKKLTLKLESVGIDKKNIISAGYKATPKYTFELTDCGRQNCPMENKMNGYDIFQPIGIKVSKVDMVQNLTQSIGSLNIAVANQNFIIEDESKFQSEARKLATKNSRDKAEEVAKSLGLKLGKVVNFEEKDSEELSQKSKIHTSSNMEVISYGGEKTIKSKVRVTYSTTTNSN